MKLPPKSGQRLVVPGIVAVALAAAGATAVFLVQQVVQKTDAEQKAAAAERQNAQNRLARATEEEREIRERLVDYRKLRDRGLIGDEQRLEWVERIVEIKSRRKLFDLKYSIEPQRAAEYPGIAGAGDVEFMVSSMKVDIALLHEEDLFRFLEDLRSALNSHVLVRSCTMLRIDRGGSERAVGPRLRADCAIDLVTIRDSKAKGA
ncbi:MAG TPA: hypothetical protein VLD36_08975 [Burkholderiales bacterium]|jgi:hypothetical protein|nr:hypothetical protein [Burkholderiales bacterium]